MKLANTIAPFVALLLFFIGVCVGGPTITPTNDVHIEVLPASIYTGLTKRLSLNCSFTHGPASDFRSVMSVILSRVNQGQDVYSELASLTSNSPDSVKVKDPSLEGHVSGQLKDGMAYIAIEWSYPSNKVGGEYRCQAFGMDDEGHPRVSQDIAEISAEESLTLDAILGKIQEMDEEQDTLHSLIAASNSQVAELQTELQKLKSEKTAIERRLNSSRDGMFEAQSSYNGSHYFLSRPVLRDLANADLTCRLFGGYLAEIRDKMEYDFVHDFLLVENGVDDEEVMLGATDETQEGVWTYVYSEDEITFSAWKDGANEGTHSNCLFFVGTYKPEGRFYDGMVTQPCTAHTIGLVRFLCEIPFEGLTP